MQNAELHEQLVRLRLQLQAYWADYAYEKNKRQCADGSSMCAYTAAFLELTLGQPWRYASGAPRYDLATNRFCGKGGFFDGRAWRGHSWVTDGVRIVDLTANQFGADDIIITVASDPRYRENISESELMASRRRVLARAELWVSQRELYESTDEIA